MNSVTTERFRTALNNLPLKIYKKAKKTYTLWKTQPFHPTLNFKQIHDHEPIYSVRIGFSFRALGRKEGKQ